MSQPVQYGYLNFQGRGQIARMLLIYTKTQFQEKLYSFGKMEEWTKDKESLGLDFPSMPYLIDGKFKLTESRAIEKYILHKAKKNDMLGKNIKQNAFIENIDGVLRDIFSGLISIFSAVNIQENRKKVFETAEAKLNYLNSCIGEKNYLLNRLSYVDFVLNVVFGYFRFFFPHEYQRWTNLEKVFQNVNSLPKIAAYYNSPKAISAMVPPEWGSSHKFTNLRPINSLQQQLSILTPVYSQTEQIRPQPVMVNVEEQISTVKSQSELKEQPVPVIRKVESTEAPKQFNSRVSDYIKAIQATNQKVASQIKQGVDKSAIVTPSKLESSLKSSGNSSILWKVNNQEGYKQKKQEKSSSIILGYWGIRGLGQIQRHLLAYCGHQFSQKIYKSREEWSDGVKGDKNSLNLPFPNLPYLISGDLKLTESLAIDRYIIRTSLKHELLGKDLKDETYIQNFVKILSDLFAEIRGLCFSEEQQKNKSEILLKINFAFSRIGQFIKNQKYTFGYLTWADFYIAQISHYVEQIFPQVYNSFEFLKRIRDSLNGNEEIQKYYGRTDSVSAPFMPSYAKISF